MKKRGKVLRDPLADPGVLSIDGQHYPFSMEVWQSDAPPKPSLPVEVELGPEGKIRAITVVPESELDKEQEALALAAGWNRGARWALDLVSRFGLRGLVAAGLLVVGWVFLTHLR
jgi:hypothetical protein